MLRTLLLDHSAESDVRESFFLDGGTPISSTSTGIPPTVCVLSLRALFLSRWVFCFPPVGVPISWLCASIRGLFGLSLRLQTRTMRNCSSWHLPMGFWRSERGQTIDGNLAPCGTPLGSMKQSRTWAWRLRQMDGVASSRRESTQRCGAREIEAEKKHRGAPKTHGQTPGRAVSHSLEL